MARSYTRDSSGKFSSGGSRGNAAATVQQNKAKKSAERRKNKNKLSGGRLGGRGKSKRSAVRQKARGGRATTKAVLNSIARARKRFG